MDIRRAVRNICRLRGVGIVRNLTKKVSRKTLRLTYG